MSSLGSSSSANATRIGQNTLVSIASDGTACAVWFDGANQNFSYASAPYTTWTTTQLAAGSVFAASLYTRSTDSIDVVTGISGHTEYYSLTKAGSSYTLGSGVSIANTVPAFDPGRVMTLVLDQQRRYWALSNTNAGTVSRALYSAVDSPQTPSWTSSLSAAIPFFGDNPVGDIVGDYLVTTYFTATAGQMQYQRADVHTASVGTWSVRANAGTTGGGADNTHVYVFRSNGAGVGMLAHSSYLGIYVESYTAATDTWGASVQLSTNANDTEPTLIKVGNDLYCFWCSYTASNDYALVCKKWQSGSATWDSSPTVLVASGTNIHNPSGSYGNSTIGLTYTVGTANPWSVNFVTISLGSVQSGNLTTRLLLQTNTASESLSTRIRLTATTPLSLYGIRQQSLLLSQANRLVANAIGGTPASNNTSIGTALGYGEIVSQGTSLPWNSASSLGDPTGLGWLWDDILLEGMQFSTGAWSPQVTLQTSSGTLTATIYMRIAARLSSGTYISIGSTSLLAQTISTTATTYILPSTIFSAVPFQTGDKAYLDVWLNIITSVGTDSATFVINSMGFAALGLTGNMEIGTPSYHPVPLKDVFTRLVLLLLTRQQDAAMRIRLRATKQTDVATRLLLQ